MRTYFKPLTALAGAVTLILAFLFVSPASAQTPFVIKIDSSQTAGVGQMVTVPVYKNAGSEDIDGFDFLIEYDDRMLTIVNVVPGIVFDIPGDYEWEYFTYRADTSGMVRIVGVADVNDGEHHPLNQYVPDNTALFELVFQSANNPYTAYQYAPIRFYWLDCGDNAISNGEELQQVLNISNQVFDFAMTGEYTDITDTTAGFPTFGGAPSFCIDTSAPDPPQRFIDFYNGGIDLLGYQDPLTGDLNLNGIPNEMADVVVFANYFMIGLAAFTINVEAQIAASDVNMDGIVLSVADFVYLIRVIEGSTIYYPDPPPAPFDGSLYIDRTDSSVIVRSDFEDAVGGLQLVLTDIPDNYEIQLLADADHMDLSQREENGNLYLTLHRLSSEPMDIEGTTIKAGPADILEIITTAPDSFEPETVSAAGYWGEAVNLDIITAESFAISIGNIAGVARGSDVSIPVTKAGGTEPMYSFDFMIAYDNSATPFQEAVPGELFDTPGAYEWEYFHYELVDYTYPIYDSTHPPVGGTVMRVTGTADIDNGSHVPASYIPADGITLFNLNFHVSYNIAYTCNLLPLYFFWLDCYDNHIIYGEQSSPSMAVSDGVYTTYNNDTMQIADPYYGFFPSYFGLQEYCLDSILSGDPPANRYTDFYNGWIEVSCDSTNEYRGDINLNGVAYEIADRVVFSNYFIYGLPALTVDPERQITASDINRNLTPLETSDFVFLWRIIYGDMTPDDTITGSGAGMLADWVGDSSLQIYGYLSMGAAALHLDFYAPDLGDYSITLDPRAEHMGLAHQLVDDHLRVLVYGLDGSGEENNTIPAGSGNILTITFAPGAGIRRLLSADAAGYYGEIIDIPVNEFDMRADINLNGVPYEIADAIVLTNYLLYGDTAFTIDPPLQLATSDVNADGRTATTSDLIYLHRVIIGWLLPIGFPDTTNLEIISGSLALNRTDSSYIIQVNAEDSLGGLYLCFYEPGLTTSDYYIRHIGVDSSMVGHNVHDDSLKILVIDYSISDPAPIAAPVITDLIEIVFNNDLPPLEYANASGYMAEWVDLNIIDEEPFEITIDRAERYILGDTIFIPVKKTGGNLPIGGYDLLIGFDTTYLDAFHPVYNFAATPFWNYFDINFHDSPGCPDCPTKLVQINAMAMAGPDSTFLIYNEIEDGTILFHLKFRTTDQLSLDSIFSTVRFFWTGCSDNVVYFYHYDTELLGYSAEVRESDGTNIADPEYGFPSPYGAAWSCYSDSGMISFVNYNNGGAGILNIDITPFNFVISIPEHGDDIPLGDSGSVTVRKEAGSEAMGGFDFLIGYDNDIYTITGVTPEEIFNTPGDYEWEYFSFRTSSDPGCDNDDCATGLLRVVGLADMNDGQPHETYQQIADGTEMFRIHFYVTTDSAYECIFAPLRFYWMDCGDNLVVFQHDTEELSGVSGLQYKWYDYEQNWNLITNDHEAGFPTFLGTQNLCFEDDPDQNLIRAAHFGNGGVDITCTDTIDDCGDINLNGIAYEIADWVVFTNYLLYGLSAFTINPYLQQLASDVNGDDNYLTVQDFVYIAKVIIGDLMPPPGCDSPIPYDTLPGTLNFIDTDTSILINGSFDDTVGAVYFCFHAPDLQDTTDYDIDIFAPLDSFKVGHNVHNDSLKILITGNFISGDPYYVDPIPPGDFYLLEVHYTGSKPQLVYATASGHMADYINLQIIVTPDPPPQFAAYPSELENDYHGGFAYDFDAFDNDILNDPISFEIVSGPGEIDPVTGEYLFTGICEETGTVYTLTVCASDAVHTCAQIDPQLYAEVSLNLVNSPPLLGDANGDGTIGIEDITCLIAQIYMDVDCTIPGEDVAEVDHLAGINILDIVYLINYLYSGGPPPECL